jgi:hypothetical protein
MTGKDLFLTVWNILKDQNEYNFLVFKCYLKRSSILSFIRKVSRIAAMNLQTCLGSSNIRILWSFKFSERYIIRLGIAGVGLLFVLLGSIGGKSPDEVESEGTKPEEVKEQR